MTKEFKTKEIRGTKTVAQKLKMARKKKETDLEKAERDTNIRLKYLEAFEDNKFSVFPSEVYAVGFLKRYAEYLSLKSDSIISQYKIEWNSAASQMDNPQKDNFSPKGNLPKFDFVITPKTVAIICIALLILSLLVYIWWAVRKFSAPPLLIITKPTQNQVITTDSIIIEGKTDPGSYIYINNEPIDVNQQGRFTQEVGLGQGMATLQIVAKNRLDRRSIHVIKVVEEKTN